MKLVSTRRMVREIIVIGAIVLLGFWALWIAAGMAFDTRVCYEDMACWDCTTMGNLICGPNA